MANTDQYLSISPPPPPPPFISFFGYHKYQFILKIKTAKTSKMPSKIFSSNLVLFVVQDLIQVH